MVRLNVARKQRYLSLLFWHRTSWCVLEIGIPFPACLILYISLFWGDLIVWFFMPVHSSESMPCYALCLHWKTKQSVFWTEFSFSRNTDHIIKLQSPYQCLQAAETINWVDMAWVVSCLTWSGGNLFLSLTIGFIFHHKAFSEALSWLWFYCCVPFVFNWQMPSRLYLLTIRKLIR